MPAVAGADAAPVVAVAGAPAVANGSDAPAGAAASGAASAADTRPPRLSPSTRPTPPALVFGQAAPATNAAVDPNALVAGAQGNNRGGGGPNDGAVPDRASVIYTQAGDYIFYVKADADGKFTLPNVRPGTYTLYAWQTQGPITQSFAKDGIVVSGDTLDLGKIDWDPPYHPNLLWQIGQADRMAGEYKFGSSPAHPANGCCKCPPTSPSPSARARKRTDWYYAQKTGTWTVNFNLAKAYSGQRLPDHRHRRRQRQRHRRHQWHAHRPDLLSARRQCRSLNQPQRRLPPQRIHLPGLGAQARRQHPYALLQRQRPDV